MVRLLVYLGKIFVVVEPHVFLARGGGRSVVGCYVVVSMFLVNKPISGILFILEMQLRFCSGNTSCLSPTQTCLLTLNSPFGQRNTMAVWNVFQKKA